MDEVLAFHDLDFVKEASVKALCLINFGSGSQQGMPLAERLISSCSDELDIMEIRWGELDKCVGEAQRYEKILIAGGDGTLSHLAPHFQGDRFKVGILPIGTGNDLARQLGFSAEEVIDRPEIAVSRFLVSSTRPLSLWRLRASDQERTFLNYASLGFDAEVVDFFARVRKNHPWIGGRFGILGNRVAYGVGGVRSLLKPRPLNGKVKVLRESGDWHSFESQKVTGFFFSNIRFVMGLGMSHPQSSPFDSMLELSLLKSPLDYCGFVWPRRSPWKPTHLESGLAWELVDLSSHGILQVDGDTLGPLKGDRLSIEPSGFVNLCVP